MCDQDTVELIVVSRLGLCGAHSLRQAMNAVPRAYMSKRTSFVTDMVNAAFRDRTKERVSEEECEYLMALLADRCEDFLQEEVSHHNERTS